ncbi:AEC family transporter [Parvularcula oceani]|uniref:AEC family transporter n=1 Tax=Parvularcula oceani TaxID=1247963 RepID=UPI0004E19722|nr:AEC family transporter [Parvularcula oceani]
MPSVALILTPLFASIGLGALSGFLRIFGSAEARILSRFVFLIAMPVAVLDFMQATEPPGPAYAGLMAGYLLAMLVSAGLAFLLSRRLLGLTTREAGAAVFATICGNAVFLGLPIAFSVPGWAPPFLILMILEGIFVFAIGTALMTWPLPGEAPPRGGVLGTALGAAWRAVRNPIVVATLIGLGLAVLHAELPEAASGFLDLFGGIAGPAGLFVLGLYVAILPRQQKTLSPLPLGVLLPVKLVLFPALTGLFVWLFTGDETFTAVALLFTGLPPAVASVVQSAHYRQYENGTAALVTGGTVVGLATVTLLLSVLLGG